MNNNTTSPNFDVKKSVLEKIASDEVKMKPHFYHTLKFTGLVFILVLTLVVSSLLVSYILFTLKISGQLFLLGFGLKGLQAFILLFPWTFLLLDCVLLIILDWSLEQFSFVYHRPFLYLIVGSLSAIVIIGYVISYTSLHGDLLRRAQNKQLPVLGGLYESVDDPQKEDGIFRGVVVGISGNTFIVRHYDLYGKNIDDKIILSNVADASKLVKIGENVFIAGERIDGEVHAYGVNTIHSSY